MGFHRTPFSFNQLGFIDGAPNTMSPPPVVIANCQSKEVLFLYQVCISNSHMIAFTIQSKSTIRKLRTWLYASYCTITLVGHLLNQILINIYTVNWVKAKKLYCAPKHDTREWLTSYTTVRGRTKYPTDLQRHTLSDTIHATIKYQCAHFHSYFQYTEWYCTHIVHHTSAQCDLQDDCAARPLPLPNVPMLQRYIV